MRKGKILAAEDHGTIWRLWYETEQGVAHIYFDHRQFAHFYEGVTGRSFFKDCGFGKGREYVSQRLKNLCMSVEGEPFSETITPED